MYTLCTLVKRQQSHRRPSKQKKKKHFTRDFKTSVSVRWPLFRQIYYFPLHVRRTHSDGTYVMFLFSQCQLSIRMILSGNRIRMTSLHQIIYLSFRVSFYLFMMRKENPISYRNREWGGKMCFRESMIFTLC